jgi:hypothetical protein
MNPVEFEPHPEHVALIEQLIRACYPYSTENDIKWTVHGEVTHLRCLLHETRGDPAPEHIKVAQRRAIERRNLERIIRDVRDMPEPRQDIIDDIAQRAREVIRLIGDDMETE